MSAAAPADPGPDGNGPGTVILFRKNHPSNRHRRRGKEEAVPAPVEPGDRSPEKVLADSVERVYLKRGLTLTDPDTAEAFLAAMDAVEIMVQGGRVHKVIDEGQSEELLAMLEGMKRAPRLV
ncbi:hypothetical protein [Streptomyces sp. NPDC007074]|uniref:hypothetical protein n=1 Tax=Streptomyces sp. NPDC007074 TaxID=3156764 RepID=UPI0033D77A63